MSLIRRKVRRIVNLFSRQKVEDAIDAELRTHIDMRVDDNLAAGMSLSQARKDALLRFGNPTAMKERVTGVDVALVLESVLSDVRYSLRQLMRNPGFTLTSMLTLALGICASISIFAFVDAALIRPLPYADPTRLVSLFESTPSGPRFHLSYPDFTDWKRLNQVFSSLEAYDDNAWLLATPGGVEEARGGMVSPGFLHTLGVAPILGRDFREGEDAPSAPGTVLLSYGTWQKRYGGRRDILGQVITLSAKPFTVIGVLPQPFHFAPVGTPEFWTPLEAYPNGDRGAHGIVAIGRLRGGISMQAATANMQAIANQLAAQYPDADAGRGATVVPLSEVIAGNTRGLMLMLLSGAGLLLLIACVNVANLLLVRAEARRREVALRGALGASRARLARQFITESLILAGLGCGLGLGGAALLIRLLVRLIPATMMGGMPYLQGLGLSTTSWLVAGGIAVIIGLLLAGVPMLRLSPRINVPVALDTRGFAGTLWRKLGGNLVVIELATAMVLLSGAGLLVESFRHLLQTEIGIRPDHVATLHIGLARAKYGKDEQVRALAQRLLEETRRLPGAQSVAIAHSLPIGNIGGNTTFSIVGRPTPGPPMEVNQREVSADYFTTLGGRLVRGRYFRDDEDASKPKVAILNRGMASLYFPHEDAVGKRITFDPATPSTEIVGIVEDLKEGPLDRTTRPVMYVPFAQDPENSFHLIVRGAQSEPAMIAAMTALVHEMDAGILVTEGQSMRDRIEESPSAYLHRSSAWLVGGFALLALILGAMGLYGVLAYSVSLRTREIGIRMALGAQRGTVYRLVLGEAGWLIAAGIGVGVLCSMGTANLLRGMLFGVGRWDLSTMASVAALLGLTALLASYVPVRRAASVDPVEALRAE